MSAERDIERVLEAWLGDGIDTMPDRVYRTILDRVDHQGQQRAWRATWKDSPVNIRVKPLMAVAAVVTVAVIGIAVVRPIPGDVSAPSATPSPSSTSVTTPALGLPVGPAGTLVRSADFSEPFTFIVPAFPPATAPVVLETWQETGDGAVAAGARAARIVSNHWGSVSFHDDATLPSDMCKPTKGRIDDIPSTPAAVGEWLGASAGLDVSAPVEVPVDGRTAMRWDVATPVGVCDATANQPAPWFGSGERHRIYAVPTPGDTILVITWGVDWSEGSEAYLDEVNAATDDLVSSIRFDD